jgi:hypothetical protein
MSDSNRLRVSIVKETTFGTTPTSPAMQVLQVTGQSLRDRVGYQQSNIINDDRNVEELVRLSKSAAGQTPIELMFSPTGEALELLLGATMCSAETAVYTDESGVSLAGGNKKVTVTTDPTSDVVAGDIIYVTSDAGSNAGYYKVTETSATTITVEADANFTADSTGVSITRAARRVNGTVNDSFTIEVARLDLGKAQIFTGCTVNMLDVTIADEAMVTANLTFEAATSTFQDTDLGTDQFIASATYTDATAHPVLDSLSIPEIRSAGTSFAAKQITLNINNNVVARTELGKLGAQSMRQGEFNVTGSFDAYFEDFSEMQAYADNTAGAIWFAVIDANSRGYSFSLPTVTFSDAGADVTGSNTDTMVSVSYQATLDSTEDCTLRMQRWA